MVSIPSSLTGKSHHFHHIPSVKGWVPTAASLLEIWGWGGRKKRRRRRKKKKADHHTPPHTVLIATVTAFRGLCETSSRKFNKPLKVWLMLIMTDPGIQLVSGSILSEQQPPKLWTGLRLNLHFIWSLALTGEQLRGREPKFPLGQPWLRGAAQRMCQCCNDSHFSRLQG